ncbi:MAG TPA: hypothetical protein VFR41_01270, partial [Acidimicrobiia bacterium]|nr:hypothetical protein [Acidimicrobiia bacterium]
YYLGLAVGFGSAVVLGVLVEFLFLRRFFNAPRLIATVATIGIAQLLLGLSVFLPDWLGDPTSNQLPDKLPWSFHLNTIVFTGNQILVLVAVPVVLLGLSAFFRFSAIGTALRATAESADRAGTLGIPVRRLQSVLWAVVGLLAFVAIFLRWGVIGNPVSQALDPLVLISALGAAVIGRLERLPTTVFAALGLGVISSEVFHAWDYDAARPVVITFVIAVALIVQNRSRISRLGSGAISTWQATREVRPIPSELRREPAVVGTQIALGAVLVGVAVALPFFLADNRIQQVTIMAIYAMVGIALVMLTGWAGQVSLGQMAIVGVAGTAAGWFVNNFDQPAVGGTVVAMLIGGAFGALVTVAIGLPTLRARGLTFAVMSLAFALMSSQYLINQGYSPLASWIPTWFRGNDVIPRPAVLSFGSHDVIRVDTDTRYYVLVLVALVLIVLAARGLRSSRTGRVLIGVRDNERSAESYGVSARRTLILAFAVTGFITGMAGALFALQRQLPLNDQLVGPDASLQLFAMVVVGGLGSIGGAVLGAVYVFGAQYFLPPEWTFLATGFGMLLVLMILPGGLGAALGDARDGLLRLYARRRNIRVPSLLADTRVVQPEPEPSLADAVTKGVFASETMAEVGD